MKTQVTWYGHAALGIETGGKRLLFDPFLSGNPVASIQPDALTPDYILISHGHGDHVGDAVEIARRTSALIISNDEICHWFEEKQGYTNVHGQHIGGGHAYDFGRVKLTPAMHGSRLPDGSDGGNPAGFLLYLTNGKKIYNAADTGLFGDMKLIGEEKIDLALLPIGDNFTMGPDDALRAVKLIKPKVVIPIHYNTFELLAQDAGQWARRVKTATQGKTRVVILKPGETYAL
ncbi:MAG TPA: metal-dependent hydrolase [Anaerolineae bacterium]|nr:metal-dependent hydrolase [Anaerolineae bacterium]